jgi:hypothetical protein
LWKEKSFWAKKLFKVAMTMKEKDRKKKKREEKRSHQPTFYAV